MTREQQSLPVDPECARCHSPVQVRDGEEWDEGDVCDSCLRDELEQVKAERDALYEALQHRGFTAFAKKALERVRGTASVSSRNNASNTES